MIEHRLGTHFNNSKISSDFVDAILRHPKSCDTVWFTTEYGFPLLKTHAEKARAAGRAAQIFRENGIGVSLQIANTIGHGEYMKAEDNAAIQEMGLKKLIGSDGIQADYAFCWNGEKLRRYTAETVKLYAAAIRPDVVWIDDDLRPVVFVRIVCARLIGSTILPLPGKNWFKRSIWGMLSGVSVGYLLFERE